MEDSSSEDSYIVPGIKGIATTEFLSSLVGQRKRSMAKPLYLATGLSLLDVSVSVTLQ